MFTSTCVFVDGRHVYQGKDCPHALNHDEAGPVVEVGWTAQSTQ